MPGKCSSSSIQSNADWRVCSAPNDAIGMNQGHAKPYRAAIILHVECVARDPESFGEMIHDLRVLVEHIGECFRIRPVPVAEAWVIGLEQVITIGQPGEKWLRQFATKTEVRAAGDASARLSARPLCKRWRVHLPVS